MPYPNPSNDLITKIDINALWWFIIFSIYTILISSISSLSNKIDRNIMISIKIYIIWIIFCVIRGVLVADNYWHWKNLIGNTFGLIVPIFAYVSCSTHNMKHILRTYIKYILPLYIIFSFLVVRSACGSWFVPITIPLCFFPTLHKRIKLVMIILAIIVITIDLSARSNVIKFSIPLLLSTLYYARFFISIAILEFVRKVFFLLPIILLFLAINDVFNPFKMEEYISNSTLNETIISNENSLYSEKLTDDTRSFLYAEVIESANKYDYWWFGRSPAKGNETFAFLDIDMTGFNERIHNEVSILNIFTWTGIVGVFIYFIIFYRATYLAINQSKSIYLKIIGLFISFRWIYAWVEDINIFSITYIFLWLMIGMCFSNSFRNMTDIELESWINSIFDNKLRIK